MSGAEGDGLVAQEMPFDQIQLSVPLGLNLRLSSAWIHTVAFISHFPEEELVRHSVLLDRPTTNEINDSDDICRDVIM